MPELPTTREEDLAEQRNARRLRLAGGAAAVVVGGALSVGLANDWPVPIRTVGWSVPLGLVVAGGLGVRGGLLTPVQTDASLVTHAELPPNDPRRSRSRFARRLFWLLAAALFVLGPAAGFATAYALRGQAPGSVRLLFVLVFSYGAMGLGLWMVRRFTGSRLWPRQ